MKGHNYVRCLNTVSSKYKPQRTGRGGGVLPAVVTTDTSPGLGDLVGVGRMEGHHASGQAVTASP